MTTERTPQPFRTGGRLWGARRVNAGVSLRRLADECGIDRGMLSLMENGRLVPTSAEYDAIIAALDRLERKGAA